jgi:hypothetical protein
MYWGIRAGMKRGTKCGGVAGDNVPPGSGAMWGARMGIMLGGVLGASVPPGNGAIAGA